MKKKKTKSFMSLSILIIGFLISSSLLNSYKSADLIDKSENQLNSTCFEKSSWIWNTTKVISTESTNFSGHPSLAMDSTGNVHIAWRDETDYAGAGTDTDIFYKRWDASIYRWTTTEVISTESTDDAVVQSLVVDSKNNLHVAWGDATDYLGSGTDIDIYYRKTIDPPVAPELAFIVTNPTEIDAIYLDWNDIFGSQQYYVYRLDYYIWSVEELVPIATVTTSEFHDTLPTEGYFYYVIVASNTAGNSSHSNC